VSQFDGPMDVLKLLDKSNCGKCEKPTCMAFAVAVFHGQTRLDACPKLESEIVKRYGGDDGETILPDRELDQAIEQWKSRIAATDLPAAARRLGATFSDGRLILKCLGKDFAVDQKGRITADIHVHGWVLMPLLSYIVEGAGKPLSGNWVPFHELQRGKARYPLFKQRCEKPLRRLADADTDLFADILDLFATRVENRYSAHTSSVLHPLPGVPILIRYWSPEDGLDSNLNVLFDSTASDNLGSESIYTLTAGLVVMFEKIALSHGLRQPLG